MTEIVLLILHLVICLILWWMMRRGWIRTRNPMIVVVLFVPVCGFLLLLMEEVDQRRSKKKKKRIGVDSLKVEDIKYRKIRMDADEDQQIAVPLEEAIVVNDASVRRRLMMDVLHRNPDEYIDLLQKTTMAEDTELTHYATTTMLEIQSRYEQEIRELTEAWQERPEDTAIMRKCRRTLQRYIDSGLLSGNILDIYRNQLDQVLEKLCLQQPEHLKYQLERLENRIILGKTEGVKETLDRLRAGHKDREEIYRVYIEYYWYRRDKEQIRAILNLLRTNKVYLSSEGRAWFEFWSQKR